MTCSRWTSLLVVGLLSLPALAQRRPPPPQFPQRPFPFKHLESAQNPSPYQNNATAPQQTAPAAPSQPSSTGSRQISPRSGATPPGAPTPQAKGTPTRPVPSCEEVRKNAKYGI